MGEAHAARQGNPAFRPALPLLALTVAALSAAVALSVAQTHPPHPELLAGYAVVGGFNALVGVWLWDRRPANGSGFLVVTYGLGIIAAACGNGPVPALRLVGQLAAEVPIAGLLHIVLAFPAGAVRERAGRWIVAGVYCSSVIYQVPQYIFSPEAEISWLQVGGHADLVKPFDTAQAITSNTLLLAAVLLLIRRWRASGPLLQRRGLAVAYVFGMLLVIGFPLTSRVLRPALDWDVFELFRIQLLLLLALPSR